MSVSASKQDRMVLRPRLVFLMAGFPHERLPDRLSPPVGVVQQHG